MYKISLDKKPLDKKRRSRSRSRSKCRSPEKTFSCIDKCLKVKNPATGRYVLRTGKLGKAILKNKAILISKAISKSNRMKLSKKSPKKSPRKSPARKSPARKSPARKSPRKSPARKSPTRKSPARKSPRKSPVKSRPYSTNYPVVFGGSSPQHSSSSRHPDRGALMPSVF